MDGLIDLTKEEAQEILNCMSVADTESMSHPDICTKIAKKLETEFPELTKSHDET